MPPFLGTKRIHQQISSDDEDDFYSNSVYTATSSSSIPTPSRQSESTPDSQASRKRKVARYSMPADSPSNMFRVGNDLFYKSQKKGPNSLPEGVNTVLELRFQMRRTKIYRVVRVPTSYTFAHLNQLILFLFGWTPSDSHHSWKLVKEVVYYKTRKYEIKQSRDWVTLSPKSEAATSAAKLGDEKDWTVAKLWGSAGVFSERAAVYTHESHEGGQAAMIDVTLCGSLKYTLPEEDSEDEYDGDDDDVDEQELENALDFEAAKRQHICRILPVVVEGNGGPSCGIEGERPDNKVFRLGTFESDAFERWLKDELVTYLTATEVRVGPRIGGGDDDDADGEYEV